MELVANPRAITICSAVFKEDNYVTNTDASVDRETVVMLVAKLCIIRSSKTKTTVGEPKRRLRTS